MKILIKKEGVSENFMKIKKIDPWKTPKTI